MDDSHTAAPRQGQSSNLTDGIVLDGTYMRLFPCMHCCRFFSGTKRRK